MQLKNKLLNGKTFEKSSWVANQTIHVGFLFGYRLANAQTHTGSMGHQLGMIIIVFGWRRWQQDVRLARRFAVHWGKRSEKRHVTSCARAELTFTSLVVGANGLILAGPVSNSLYIVAKTKTLKKLGELVKSILVETFSLMSPIKMALLLNKQQCIDDLNANVKWLKF